MRKAAREANKKNKKTLKEKLKLKLQNIDKKKVLTLVGVIVVVLVIIAINNYTALGLVLNKNINSGDAIHIELQTTNNKIIPFNNEVIVYNQGKMLFYDNYGRQTGTLTLEDTLDADIQTSGKYIQIVNKDKKIVYVYKNKYEVGRIKIEGDIYSANINKQGISVIEYSSNGNKTELGIYESSGEKIYNIKLSNKIIGKYVLSDDSRYLAYIDVNISGISAQTNINVIDLNNIKEDEINAKTIHTNNNFLAYDIYFSGKTVIARFEQEYMIYDMSYNKKQLGQIVDGQLVSIGEYNKKYAYTRLDENGDYVLGFGKMLSDKVKEILIKDTPKYFNYENGIAYVCYAKKIEAYNNYGMKIKNYDSDMIVTEPIVFNNGRSVVMAISNKLIMFTI